MHLTTARLVLREFAIDDWPHLLAYQRDPSYLRFYPWTGRTEGDVRDFVQMFVDQQEEQPGRKFQLALTLTVGYAALRTPREGVEWFADEPLS